MESKFDNSVVYSINDYLSMCFDGYVGDDGYDKFVRLSATICKKLKTNERDGVVVVLTSDDDEFNPSYYYTPVTGNDRLGYNIYNEFGFDFIQTTQGYDTILWFAEEDDAKFYLNQMQIEIETGSLYENLNESAGSLQRLASRVAKNNMEYDDEIDATYAEDDDYMVQIQDRESNSIRFDKNLNKLDKNPRVSTNSWIRVWKDGEMIKQFEGPKYEARQQLLKYLRSEDDTE